MTEEDEPTHMKMVVTKKSLVVVVCKWCSAEFESMTSFACGSIRYGSRADSQSYQCRISELQQELEDWKDDADAEAHEADAQRSINSGLKSDIELLSASVNKWREDFYKMRDRLIRMEQQRDEAEEINRMTQEEKKSAPALEFKEGDWVIFKPTGKLYRLDDPDGRSTHFHLYSVGHGTLRRDLCRQATLEEMFRPGALVQFHKDDLKIEGRVGNYATGYVRIIGAGGMSFHPNSVTLLEPAPKEKENGDDDRD